MTPRLPSMTAPEVVRILERHGFERVRHSGSHLILRHPDGRRVTVPVHKSKDLDSNRSWARRAAVLLIVCTSACAPAPPNPAPRVSPAANRATGAEPAESTVRREYGRGDSRLVDYPGWPSTTGERVCYATSTAAWEPADTQYGTWDPPARIELRGERGRQAATRGDFEFGHHLLRPRLDFGMGTSSATWSTPAPDSVVLGWSTGFVGVTVRARRTGARLEGVATSWADGIIVGGGPFPQAAFRAAEVTCPDEP